ncbi:MAG: hypothetical protein KQI62_01965 [Deltaproteobacteria bacterium]|nr:hypothetical protein [Deltaproteobacteria bacterium]
MKKSRKVRTRVLLTVITCAVFMICSASAWAQCTDCGTTNVDNSSTNLSATSYSVQESVQYSNNNPISQAAGGQGIAFLDLSNSFNTKINAPIGDQLPAFPLNVTPLYRNGPQNGGGLFPLLDAIPEGDVEALATEPTETESGVMVWAGTEHVYALYKGDAEETEWTAIAKALHAAKQSGGSIKGLSTDIHAKNGRLNALYTRSGRVWMAKPSLTGIFIKRRLKPEAWGLGLAVGAQHGRLEGDGPGVFTAQVSGAFGFGTSEVLVRPVVMVVAAVTKTAKK